MDEFSTALGTFINEQKSQVFFFNTLLCIDNNIDYLLGFQRSTLPTKYLGIPITDNSLR